MMVFYSLRQGTLEFMSDMIFGMNKINRYSIHVLHLTLHNACMQLRITRTRSAIQLLVMWIL